MALAKKIEHFSEDMLSEKAKQVLASLRLEGLRPDEAQLADMVLYDQGKLTFDKLIERNRERLKKQHH